MKGLWVCCWFKNMTYISKCQQDRVKVQHYTKKDKKHSKACKTNANLWRKKRRLPKVRHKTVPIVIPCGSNAFRKSHLYTTAGPYTNPKHHLITNVLLLVIGKTCEPMYSEGWKTTYSEIVWPPSQALLPCINPYSLFPCRASAFTFSPEKSVFPSF